MTTRETGVKRERERDQSGEVGDEGMRKEERKTNGKYGEEKFEPRREMGMK